MEVDKNQIYFLSTVKIYWQGYEESNLKICSQSAMLYHLTIPQLKMLAYSFAVVNS